MTIKELYEWAVSSKVENCNIVVHNIYGVKTDKIRSPVVTFFDDTKLVELNGDLTYPPKCITQKIKKDKGHSFCYATDDVNKFVCDRCGCKDTASHLCYSCGAIFDYVSYKPIPWRNNIN